MRLGNRIYRPGIFSSTDCRRECLKDPVLVDRISDLTHSGLAVLNDSISDKCVYAGVVGVENNTSLIRSDSHENTFKLRVSTDVGKQMVYIRVPFAQELRMRF